MKTFPIIIFCAGKGERMRPFTYHTPKPLFPIEGKPILFHHLDKLIQAGFTDIIINHAYFGDQIRQATRPYQEKANLHFSPEPPGGLETGGGLYLAKKWLKKGLFGMVLGDIYTDFDYVTIKTFPDKMITHQTVAHLLLVPTPKTRAKGDFALNESLLLNTPTPYVYSGISVFQDTFLDYFNLDKVSMTPPLRALVEQNNVSGELYTGHWEDVGRLK